jgi:NNMT/PNMT/TEMT family
LTSAARKLRALPFDAWRADEYLRDYYSKVEIDEALTLEFVLREARKIAPGAAAIEFGAGPTAHHLIALSAYVSAIDAADFLQPNLREIGKWMHNGTGAHDWRPFVRHILCCEGKELPTEFNIRTREALARRRLSRILYCDASRPRPLGVNSSHSYDVLLTFYCADSATGDKEEWRRYMLNILGLLKPGGMLIMAALRNCSGYKVGENWFPCADIDEMDLRSVLELSGFDPSQTFIDVKEVPGQSSRGYESILLASGRKTRLDLS